MEEVRERKGTKRYRAIAHNHQRSRGEREESTHRTSGVSPPHLVSEIFDIYKVLNRWDFQYLLASETPDSGDRLSLYKIRNMRDGARMIACWALKEGFTVLFLKWDDRLQYERVENCDFMAIDQLVKPVLGSRHDGLPVEEGFMIAW